MKFKVGDIIRGKEDNGYAYTDGRMTKAKVIKSYDDVIEIKILEHKNDTFIGNTYSVDNSDELFELAFLKKLTVKELLDMPTGTMIKTINEEGEYDTYLKSEDGSFLNSYDNCLDEDCICDDLTTCDDEEIIEVCKPTYTTIYKKEKKKEMTISEIEKELGYLVKIIKEDNENEK